MKIDAPWLQSRETQAVFKALTAQGAQAWAVGGCVRDTIVGRAVADVDLATDVPPDVAMQAALAAGLRVIPTGIEHGTITVVSGKVAHEVTSLRVDLETDGRHAKVGFTRQIALDAARRDLTMNALYAAADGEVIDPLGGLADLLAGHVRFVGDPAARIAEDALRILRFFRFTATYGAAPMGIDAEGLAACAAGAAGLARLSRDRVGAEMQRLLAAPDPAPVVASMAAGGILAHVLPGAIPSALPVLVHLEGEFGMAPHWLARLACLGPVEAKAALRLSRRQARDLDAIKDGAAGDLGHAALGFVLKDLAPDAALVRAALGGQALAPAWQSEIARGQSVAAAPISAADLSAHLAGAGLGAELLRLNRLWLLSELRLTRDEILQGRI